MKKKLSIDCCCRCSHLIPYWIPPKHSELGGSPSGYLCEKLNGRHIPEDEFFKFQPDCPLEDDV